MGDAPAAKTPALNVFNGPTIQAGQVQSETMPIGADFIVGIIMPDDWTPAVATLVVSPDGNLFYDLFDATGREFVFNVTPGVMVAVNPNLMMMAGYMQIRSGTRDNPVVQETTRRFKAIGAQSIALLASSTR
jgi:hypothetical protein